MTTTTISAHTVSAPGGYLLPIDVPAEDGGLIGSTIAWLAAGSPRETSFDLVQGDDDAALGFFTVRVLDDQTVEVSYPEREGDDPSSDSFFPTEEIEDWASMVIGHPVVCDGGHQDNDGRGRVTETWQMVPASLPEVAEVAEVAWPAGSWQADHHPIQVMDLRGLFDLVDQLAACFGGASQVRPEHLGDAIAGRIINSNGSAPSFDDLAAWHHERWGYVVEWEDGDDERWAAAVVAAANRRLRDEARRERDVFIARLLRERDEAREEGDALARAVADHLAGRPGDLTAALRRYGERGGPAFALAPR